MLIIVVNFVLFFCIFFMFIFEILDSVDTGLDDAKEIDLRERKKKDKHLNE